MTTELQHAQFQGHLVSPLLSFCKSLSRPRDLSKFDDIACTPKKHTTKTDLMQQTDHGNSFIYANVTSPPPSTLAKPSAGLSLPKAPAWSSLTLLLQLNPVPGMAPNISMETNVIIKLLLKSRRSRTALRKQDLAPTDHSLLSKRDSHLQHSTSSGSQPLEMPGKHILPLPLGKFTDQHCWAQMPSLSNNLSRMGWRFSSHPAVPPEMPKFPQPSQH